MTCYCVFGNRMKIDLMKTTPCPSATAFVLARIDLNRRNWIASKAQRLTGLRKDNLEMEKKKADNFLFSCYRSDKHHKVATFCFGKASFASSEPLRSLLAPIGTTVCSIPVGHDFLLERTTFNQIPFLRVSRSRKEKFLHTHYFFLLVMNWQHWCFQQRKRSKNVCFDFNLLVIQNAMFAFRLAGHGIDNAIKIHKFAQMDGLDGKFVEKWVKLGRKFDWIPQY